MTDKPKGIVDPWRTVDPVRPPERNREPTPARKDLDDIDFDADLAIPGRYTIRSTHVSFAVVSVRIQSPKDALDVLADCIADTWMVKTLATALLDAGIGVRCRNRMFNVPSEDGTASMLTGGDTKLWFTETSLDRGMFELARILRMHEAVNVCKKHGVTVMTNA